jgi:hypothetical protein
LDGTIVAKTKKGEKSIEVYGLYREELIDDRKEIISDIEGKIHQIKGCLRALAEFRKIKEKFGSQDVPINELVNINISYMIIAFKSIENYFIDENKPHRGMVFQITENFMQLYSDSINKLVMAHYNVNKQQAM